MITPKTAGNPNGLNLDFQMIRKAVEYIKRKRTVFGLQIQNEFTITNRTMFNAAALYKQLQNLVMRAKKGDRNGTGTEFRELSLKVGLLLTSDTVLPAPTAIYLSEPAGDVVISWPSVVGATNYIVQRATASNFTGATQVYSGANLTHTDTTAAGATTYYYRVKAQRTGFTDSLWKSGSILTA